MPGIFFSRTFALLSLSQILASSGFLLPNSVRQTRIPGNQLHVEPKSTQCDSASNSNKEVNNVVSDRRRSLIKSLQTVAGSVVALGGGLAFTSNDPSTIAQAMELGDIVNFGNGNGASSSGSKRRLGGLANKIRGICQDMDELQRDLMQERWDLVQTYPPQLRSYVPVFTTYTDAAFPSEIPSDWGLRVALRYEVGRYFASLERFKRAAEREALTDAYIAFSDMSLHLDRYLRVGGLYTYYDSTIDNEQYFAGYLDSIVHSDPRKDPAEVRDLVVICRGPDTGKTGIVIGIYPSDDKRSQLCCVKLDKVRGMREIRVVPLLWAAKRLGEQDPDDVFLIPREKKRLALSNGAKRSNRVSV